MKRVKTLTGCVAGASGSWGAFQRKSWFALPEAQHKASAVVVHLRPRSSSIAELSLLRKMSTTAATGLSREKLEGEERERRLREEVPYWQQVSCRDAIQRTFTFKDFKEAWRFMNLAAVKAEEVRAPPLPHLVDLQSIQFTRMVEI
jgi:pterin-4a-carbinolamine dehydratase